MWRRSLARWAISYHFIHSFEASTKELKRVITAESIKYGFDILQGIQNENKSVKKAHGRTTKSGKALPQEI
ncbi:unnamed protein product [Lathyrus sativus]|nr:unnamed protein product [Lathyrus sativus]